MSWMFRTLSARRGFGDETRTASTHTKSAKRITIYSRAISFLRDPARASISYSIRPDPPARSATSPFSRGAWRNRLINVSAQDRKDQRKIAEARRRALRQAPRRSSLGLGPLTGYAVSGPPFSDSALAPSP